MTAKSAAEKRFLEKFFQDISGCWLWTGSVNACGYGTIGRNGRSGLAHRLAYEMYCGPIPEGLNVLHKCDTPRCVNPDHLFLGTQAENIADMESKGRSVHPHSENHGRATLTNEEVRLIRQSKLKRRELAEFFSFRRLELNMLVRKVRGEGRYEDSHCDHDN